MCILYSVEQSALTGESLPVNKSRGDEAFCGSHCVKVCDAYIFRFSKVCFPRRVRVWLLCIKQASIVWWGNRQSSSIAPLISDPLKSFSRYEIVSLHFGLLLQHSFFTAYFVQFVDWCICSHCHYLHYSISSWKNISSSTYGTGKSCACFACCCYSCSVAR